MALITVTALAVAWGQLRLQRTTAGGRGLLLGAGPTGMQMVRNGIVSNRYRVEVKIAGPKVWHELGVVLEKDGREFEAPDRPPTRKTMTSESEAIVWDFELSPEDGERVWCLVTWAEPRGSALRTDALATPLRRG